ncbi:MAG: transporter transrane region protein [Verrucomicrobiaceae bacterium]|nr:transporter transrane region protein [Verrucomicrobiaceae bacterium]
MTNTKNLGMLLLAVYLIVAGACGVFGISLGSLHMLIPLLALISGILLLMGK